MRRPTYAYAYIPGEKSSARKDTKINEERRSVLEYRNTLYTLSERDTGPFSRRTGIIISSAPCRDRYDEHGPVKGARGEATMKRTSAAASRGKRTETEDRERSRYTLQVRARVSRAANEPAAARLLATRSQLLICDWPSGTDALVVTPYHPITSRQSRNVASSEHPLIFVHHHS